MTQHAISSDLLRVKDMIGAIDDATAFAAGGLEERAHLFATAYAVAIIGEACSHISPAVKQRFADVPWSRIIGARHKIIHEYGKVDVVILEEVVRSHLPLLKQQMQAILLYLSDGNAP